LVLTGPTSGTAQLYETIVQLFCQPQCVELSQGLQFMKKKMEMWTVLGAACSFERVHGTRHTAHGTRHTEHGTRNTLKPATQNTRKPTGCSKYCAHFHLYTHTLKNLRQFYILSLKEGLDDCVIQLCTPWWWAS